MLSLVRQGMEVRRLQEKGLSNRMIASQMIVDPRTIESSLRVLEIYERAELTKIGKANLREIINRCRLNFGQARMLVRLVFPKHDADEILEGVKYEMVE